MQSLNTEQSTYMLCKKIIQNGFSWLTLSITEFEYSI